MRHSPIEQVLESALNGVQLRVEIVEDIRYCGAWLEREPATRNGAFHLIGEGRCVIEAPALDGPLVLEAGDLVMFPHGSGHLLRGADSCVPIGGVDPGYTSMLCGEFSFLIGAHNPVLRALPDCVVVHARDGGEAFAHLAALLIDTSRRGGLGRQITLNTLAASLFILAVCEYATQNAHPRGLFAGSADPRIARVLQAIHARPEEDWSMARLADLAGMSRSAFAERFTTLLETPPMQYLARWRVSQAWQLLKNPRLSVAAIAEPLGYKSEPAFRKLFKRLTGIGPGRVRAGEDVGAP